MPYHIYYLLTALFIAIPTKSFGFCAICQDSLEGEYITLERCQHSFHKQCAGYWFSFCNTDPDKQVCLLCQQPLNANDKAVFLPDLKILHAKLRKELLATIPSLVRVAATIVYGYVHYSIFVDTFDVISNFLASAQSILGKYPVMLCTAIYSWYPLFSLSERWAPPENKLHVRCSKIHSILLQMKAKGSTRAERLLTTFEWLKNIGQSTQEKIAAFCKTCNNSIKGLLCIPVRH